MCVYIVQMVKGDVRALIILERQLRWLRCKLPDEIRLEIWRKLSIELDHMDIRRVVRSYYRDPNVIH